MADGIELNLGGARYVVESDLHTHTRYSHGKGTIEENVKAAVALGLKQIGITDHAPGHVGFGVPRKKLVEMKAEIIRLRREYPQIEILFGIEADIIAPSGRLDIRKDEYEYFDFICAGWHYGAIDGLTPAGAARTLGNIILNTEQKATNRQLKRNTDTIVRAVEAGGIKFLTHPGSSAPVDLIEVAAACARTGTLFEINTNHMSLTPEAAKPLLLTDVRFIVCSDAHAPSRIGDFRPAEKLINEAGIDHARIINLRKA